MKKTITKIATTAILLSAPVMAMATADCDVGCVGENVSKGGSGVLSAIYVGLLIIGLLMAASGVMGLIQGRQSQEGKGTQWAKIAGGSVVAGIFGLILAVNSQFFGNAEEVREARTLIESAT